MKKSEKYPSATEDQIKSLPPPLKILGLHPLVWAVIVVLGIAAARACDNVEELGCDFFEWYEVEDDDDEEDQGDDKEEDEEERDLGDD